MAEQIPEAWIGQEVTVYFDSAVHRHRGVLESVSERGIVVRSTHGVEDEHIFWYPLTSYSGSCRARRWERKYAHT
jgi:hypothetical protein